jgi:hypothetical protein
MQTSQTAPGRSWQRLNATRVTASVLGVLVGISGLDHGFFETLQGNTPTPGLIVRAIGPAQRMWVYGTEEAFSLVPNFLATGILAMTLGVLVILWSIRFIDRRNGSGVFLLLSTLLFLVGGGVAMVGLVCVCWAVSRRIDRPPRWCRKVLPVGAGRLWLACLGISLALFAIALEIAIWGFVPGAGNPDQARMICWSSLGVMLAVLLLAIVAGFAHDIGRETVRAHTGTSR